MCNKFRYIRTMVFFCLCELKIQHHLDLPKLASCDSLCYILHSKYQRKRVYSIYLFQQNRAQRRKNREEKCRCVISAQISYENWLLTCAKTSHKCTQCCPNYIARWTNGVCKWIDIFAKYSFCAAKWQRPKVYRRQYQPSIHLIFHQLFLIHIRSLLQRLIFA